ncbi:acyl carrier protein [Seinonella peptonophila]|uniref:Acyl carrier protein n=1 Tax=Seinonella peptonophila TaxID=112248 RepID=A0A1M4UTH3_9BACL|nr:acyl carrier protein [Seinonella peptonophila]SHE59979.1 acyl carrier protein [Seinonella peptonophila]
MADTFNRVKELIVEHLDVKPEEVTLEAGIKDDLGADSLDVVDLILNLEQEFDLDQIEEEDSEKIVTVGDIVTYIEKQKQEQK